MASIPADNSVQSDWVQVVNRIIADEGVTIDSTKDSYGIGAKPPLQVRVVGAALVKEQTCGSVIVFG